ncbi:MAG: gamma-glutamyltransferase [Chloroflexota bacterium]|nr:MAG: gamma-glutamyltransferase [Chloroflexota bacterium]
MSGMIAAGDPQTAAAGAAMLRKGGNAVDAAVAAAFASFLAEVGVVHLGGSGIAQVLRPEADGVGFSSQTYDFFSTTPGLEGSASPNPIDFERVTIDFGPTTQDFYLGRGSVAVPGNIAGLCRMAADHGRLPLRALLEPAMKLAREGVRLSSFQAETCALLEPIYTHSAGMRSIFASRGRVIASGERLKIPHLERTLAALAREGPDYAQHGRLARAIADDQAANGGLLTATDLATFRVRRLTPIRLVYRDFEILLPPPSSTGGVLTAFSFRLLSHFDVGRYEHSSIEHLRLLYEVMAATSRARPVWDRATETLPDDDALAYFLSDAFVAHYVDEVKLGLEGVAQLPALSEPDFHPDTSHLSVIDNEGMAVSLTTTAGETAGYVVPGTGFIPNNILGEEDLHPAGFHARRPGERIPTMMTPAIVLHQGNVRLVVGSGGSIRIRSAILQVLSNLLDFKMRLVESVNVARVHLENGVLQCELGYDEAAVDALEAIGYRVNRWDRRSIYFGGAHSVSRTQAGRLVAAGDDRRGGAIAIAD